MNHHSRLGRHIGSVVILLLFSIIGFRANAQGGGQALFAANCASCHQVNKRLVGPALAGVESRGPWGDRKQLHAWVHNPAGFMKTDGYTAGLFKEYNVMMQAFPGLPDKDIDAIIDYVKSVPAATAATPGAPNDETANAQAESDNTLLFGILTLILAIVAFVLLQVNSNLRKLADDKEGLAGNEPLPFWRNKGYIAFVCVILFLVGGYLTVQGAIGLGRSQHYEPEQPIFYSHKVHAGTNQISCFYCHGNTDLGKQANIPSVNICMNCHMGINEYKGPDKLIDGDGKERDGTAEIQKLYKYAGYEYGKIWDVSKATPIPWIRIHYPARPCLLQPLSARKSR